MYPNIEQNVAKKNPEKFEDKYERSNGSRKSKDRQCNGQKIKDKQ